MTFFMSFQCFSASGIATIALGRQVSNLRMRAPKTGALLLATPQYALRSTAGKRRRTWKLKCGRSDELEPGNNRMPNEKGRPSCKLPRELPQVQFIFGLECAFTNLVLLKMM
jgi:hypothetical protein